MTRRPLLLALCLACLGTTAAAADNDIEKLNGSITVGDGERAGDVSTVNGSIRIGDRARVADGETVNGSIRGGAGVQAGELSTVNGGIKLGENARVEHDLSTVNGEIFVDRGGNVGGGIETVNGAIGLVDTDLGGGIETVNGDLTVGAGSHVRGGIHYEEASQHWFSTNSREPRVVIGPNARVDGPLVFEREVKLFVHGTAKIGPVSGATAVRYQGDRAPQE